MNLLGNSLKQFMGPFDVNCWTIFLTQFFGQLSDKIIIFNNFIKEFIVCDDAFFNRTGLECVGVVGQELELLPG